MANRYVRNNLYLAHKKTNNQDYLEELARQQRQNEANVARGVRIADANQATADRFAREAQAAQNRGTTSSPSAPAKGYVTSADSSSTGERINAANRQASEGQHGSKNKTGVNWSDPNSPSYKAWKKAYNTAYYAENSDYWVKRYIAAHPASGRVHATSGTQYEGAARSGREAEIRGGAEAMRREAAKRAGEQAVYDWSRGEASRGMHGRTTQAQAALASAARDTSVSTKYGLGARAKDLGREIINSGKNYVNNYADGAKQIKDLWSIGAKSIANSGKAFLDKLTK